MMDSVGRITLAARKGRGKDAAKEVYIAAFPVLRARFFERCKAAHMTGNAVMNRMAEEYLSDLAAGRDRSRELLSLVEGVKERMEQQGASGSLLTERFIARVPASVKDRLAENCEHYGCSVNATAFFFKNAVAGVSLKMPAQLDELGATAGASGVTLESIRTLSFGPQSMERSSSKM